MRYVVEGPPERVTVCHCTWCQRRTGSAFGVEAMFMADAVEFAGDTLQIYRHISDESGRWLEQAFCSTCGANIGFTLEAVPGFRTIAAGTFDDPSWVTSDKYLFRHVFMRSDRGWADVPEGVERYKRHFRE